MFTIYFVHCKFLVSLFLCDVVVQQLGSQLVNFDQNQSCECLSLLKVYDGFALGPHE